MSARRSWSAWLVLTYPPGWRARYGDELGLLIQDLHGHGRRLAPMAADLLRGAVIAWLTERRSQMSEHSRRALITVLWSWVAFAATAAWFGHDLGASSGQVWAWSARPVALLVPSGVPDAYHILLVAGVVGVVATAVAAAAFVVEAARYARRQRRRSTFALMAVPPVVAACWLGGLRLIPGGTHSAVGLGVSVGWLLLGVAGIAGSTQAVVTVIRSSEFGERTWRTGAVAAAVVTAAMVVATGATISWGVAERSSQAHPGDAAGWLVVVTIMAVTTVRAIIALIGARRVAPGEPATV